MKNMMIAATLFLAATASAETGDWKEKILEAHGIDQWETVDEIEFTFVVERPNARTARAWTWDPDTGQVTMEQDGQSITYDRDELEGASEEIVSTDKKFINDSFWLLWPLHMKWAEDATLQVRGQAECPLTGEETTLAILAYPAEGGGYTPGDEYYLYLDEDGKPRSWEFHRGGAPEAALINTFENYKEFGPLSIATVHKNEDGSFALLFENVGVDVKEEGEEE